MTPEQIVAIMPECPLERAKVYADPLTKAMEKYEINTVRRQAAFIAQIAHESGSLKYNRELWGPTPAQIRYNSRADLGNTLPEAIQIASAHNSYPGFWWRGHGLIQITGYKNHKKYGEKLGLDLLNTPELIQKPEGSAMVSASYWDDHNLNPLADKNDMREITIQVNGGLNGYLNRLKFWHTAMSVLMV